MSRIKSETTMFLYIGIRDSKFSKSSILPRKYKKILSKYSGHIFTTLGKKGAAHSTNIDNLFTI